MEATQQNMLEDAATKWLQADLKQNIKCFVPSCVRQPEKLDGLRAMDEALTQWEGEWGSLGGICANMCEKGWLAKSTWAIF